MWPKTEERVRLELALLRRLLDDHRDLIERAGQCEPGRTERLALAALLHSFYTGIESIFKRIALEIDGFLPAGGRSHADLLVQMSSEISVRKPVVGDGLRECLGAYMDFRHVFRHAYSFDLVWPKMAGLVAECPKTLDDIREQLDRFFGDSPNATAD